MCNDTLPTLFDNLSLRGFNKKEIEKITTKNYLWVLNEILPA